VSVNRSVRERVYPVKDLIIGLTLDRLFSIASENKNRPTPLAATWHALCITQKRKEEAMKTKTNVKAGQRQVVANR